VTDVDESVSESTIKSIEKAVSHPDLAELTTLLEGLSIPQVIDVLERLVSTRGAVAYRMLSKDRAQVVFDILDASLQSDLVRALQDEDVAELFAAWTPTIG
jgi:magnesium transporter